MGRLLTGPVRQGRGRADLYPVVRHGTIYDLAAGGAHRLHYCDWGHPDNPRVVVCVHGEDGSARDFDALARALSVQHRVICPDLAVRGDSDWLGTTIEYGFPQMLADLDVLVSHIDAWQLDWVGTSLGGVLGMHIAARPGTPVRRLVMNEIGSQSTSAGGDFRKVWRAVSCPTLLLRKEHSKAFPRTTADWMLEAHVRAQRVDISGRRGLTSPLEIDAIADFFSAGS